jgi:hypothetical protein
MERYVPTNWKPLAREIDKLLNEQIPGGYKTKYYITPGFYLYDVDPKKYPLLAKECLMTQKRYVTSFLLAQGRLKRNPDHSNANVLVLPGAP